jgi:hypothetical protein
LIAGAIDQAQQCDERFRAVLVKRNLGGFQAAMSDPSEIGFEGSRIEGGPARVERLRQSLQGKEQALANDTSAHGAERVGRLHHRRRTASHRVPSQLDPGVLDDLSCEDGRARQSGIVAVTSGRRMTPTQGGPKQQDEPCASAPAGAPAVNRAVLSHVRDAPVKFLHPVPFIGTPRPAR